MIDFKVIGQRMICGLPDALASGQVDFATFRFEFSPDWDGLDKTAQFQQGDTIYNMHLGTGTPLTCYMPAEIVDGIVLVSVFGLEAGGDTVATTAPQRLRVARSGYGSGIDGDSGLTPSLYAQLIEEIDAKIAAACTSAYCTVETDEDGVVTITATDVNGQTVATVTSAYITAEQTETGATITTKDANGETVVSITNGADGQDGQDGADGASAYEIWLEQGNTGTEEEFLAALKGEKGDTGEQGEKGDPGETGEDGYSPEATVTQTETGAIISITDAVGTTTAEITNGVDGADGEAGADGYSPSASVTQTETGATITITDETGTTTATISNGQDGADGEAGADGKDGADGADGVSPTVEVFKQAAIWGIDSGTAYFDGDTSVTSFDVTDLDSVELVCWWISSGDSIPLTVTLTDSSGNTTTQTANLGTGDSVTVDTSNAVSIAIATSGSQTATGQLIYNDETAETGYYLKITWYNDDTGETEIIITDNLKGTQGEQGEQGEAGADGYSPSATVTQTSTGATITITDASGTTTADITNGSGGGSDLTGGETDYGVIDITDNVVTLSSAVGKSTGVTGAEIFNDYTNNYATGNYSTAMGQYSTASGQNSLAACAAQAQGDYSIAMGISCVAGNMYSVAIGNTAKTTANHGISIGYYTTASGTHAVAMGSNSTASGGNSYAVGNHSTASAVGAAAIGYNVEASGQCGMALNGDTLASGAWTLAAGRGTTAASNYQTAIGKYNIADEDETYAFIIGNGTSDDSRSNLFAIGWNGDLIINGDTNVTEAVTDSGWQTATLSSGSTYFTDVTVQYRTIGAQLYVKGQFTASSAIAAGSVSYAITSLIGENGTFIAGAGSVAGIESGETVIARLSSENLSHLSFYNPVAISSGSTIYFSLAGTID